VVPTVQHWKKATDTPALRGAARLRVVVSEIAPDLTTRTRWREPQKQTRPPPPIRGD
jgi:hypothetical protein